MSDEKPDLKRTRRQKDYSGALKIDRLPPSSVEAEQAMLGCMIIAAEECVPMAVEKMGKHGSGNLYDLRHQTIYDCICMMREEARPIDLVTLRQELKDIGQLEAVGGIAYITSLIDCTPSPANMPFYLDIVIEKAVLRRMVQTCTNVVGQIYEQENGGDVEQLVDELERQILSISQERAEADKDKSIRSLVSASIDKIEAMASGNAPMGIPTGFPDLDKLTTGLHDGEMIVIAARPSLGKTSLAMNIAEHVACNLNLPVGVFSLEMQAESLVMRTISSMARVNLRAITEREMLTEADMAKLMVASSKLANAPLFIDDTSGLSILQLRAKARRMKQKHGIKLLVIDYLQLLRGSKKNYDSRQNEVADISSGVKGLAKELGVPVIALSQLNREIEKRGGDKPKMSDLRESGSLEQDADLIALLYRPQIEDEEDQSSYDSCAVNMFIAKQRNGPAQIDVHFSFLKIFTRYESAAKVSEEDIPKDRGRVGKEKAVGSD